MALSPTIVAITSQAYDGLERELIVETLKQLKALGVAEADLRPGNTFELKNEGGVKVVTADKIMVDEPDYFHPLGVPDRERWKAAPPTMNRKARRAAGARKKGR